MSTKAEPWTGRYPNEVHKGSKRTCSTVKHSPIADEFFAVGASTISFFKVLIKDSIFGLSIFMSKYPVFVD